MKFTNVREMQAYYAQQRWERDLAHAASLGRMVAQLEKHYPLGSQALITLEQVILAAYDAEMEME